MAADTFGPLLHVPETDAAVFADPGQRREHRREHRMAAQFGDTYARSVARDYVFDELGGRTIERALADGEDAKVVWRAVCDTFNVPESLR